MAVIPKKQSTRSLDIGRGAQVINIDGGLGSAMVGASDAVTNFSMELAKKEQRKDDFRAENEYQKLQLHHQSAMDESKNAIEGDGTGFHDNFMGDDFQKRNSDFITSLPRRLQDKYASRASVDNERWGINAARIESKQLQDHDRFEIGNRAENIRSAVYSDDSSFNEGVTKGVALINSSSLSKLEKEKLSRELRMSSIESRDLGVIERDIDYAKAVSNGISPNYIAKLIGNESSGVADAKNPNSSATGLGQFTKGTWTEFMKERHSDTKGDWQKLRNDPDLSKQAIVWYAQKNAKKLSDAGLPVNDATVYLSHFAGPAGAKNLLKANTNETAESVLGKEVIKANPFLKDMTAGEVVDWASRKMTGANSDLSFPAMSRVRRAATIKVREHTTQQRLDYQKHKDQMMLGIKTHSVEDERQILKDTTLDDGDKATLIGAFRAEASRKKQSDEVENILLNRGAINIYEKDDRKALDAAYIKTIEAAGEDQKIVAAKQFIERSRYVPDTLVADIRSGLISNDSETALSSIQIAQHALDVNPNAFAGRAGDKGVQKAVDAYNAYIKQGYSEEQAIERYQLSQDREVQAKRSIILDDTETKKWLKDEATPDQVRARFDKWNTFKPDYVSEAQGLAIASEFKQHLEDALVDVGGDQDAAREVAKSRMNRMYGVSNLNLGGDNILMRHPPEKHWPKVNRSHDYVTKELKEMVSKYQGVDIDEVFLQADKHTEQDIKAGEIPRYQVWFKDENNVVQMIPGGHFVPDIAKANKEAPKPKSAWERNKAGQKALEQYYKEYGFGRREGAL
ncbi:MAG: lytic transglycosylase domain-containing protein [Desulfobacteraceae bacterium]|nr:lytic transglycosylase domain-containing protein [Desulfobacteraceae bacterium]